LTVQKNFDQTIYSDVAQSGFCSSFCGWHTYGGNYVFAWIGVPPSGCNCFSQSISPNGNAGVDAAVSTIAHELAESVTNPYFNGWYYSSSSTGTVENGDQCAWYFPNAVKQASGAYYNIIVNGLYYLIQADWNLSTTTCSMS
jgi:hypothetical protein